ncbi:MAG: DUF1254 domain-containing protein [Methylomonas lenta]|nr:DUF1254 domain-containing protein [Methylomonas lenta]
MKIRHMFTTIALVAAFVVAPLAQASDLTPAEARVIAKEAYIYGYPLVDNYRIQYAYYVDKNNPQYMAPWNHIKNIHNVYTPADTAVQTPNSDTPYSWIGLDLRAEPIVISLPAIEKTRYYDVQMWDAYTYIIGYAGSRTTGNDAGNVMVVGPGWKGETPKGIKKVYVSDTDFGNVVFRTQLFDPADIDNVVKIQNQYKVQPLSAFLGTTPPSSAPVVNFIKPLTKEEQKTSLEFFNIMSFVLGYSPTVPSEVALRESFAKIGIEGGKTFDPAKLSPAMKTAIEQGRADALQAYDDGLKLMGEGKITSGDVFGSRAFLGDNYLYRYLGTLGIYGNAKEEAMYPVYRVDSEGQALSGANRYTMHFAADQYPPVHAFWSLTMYDVPQSLLVANPINRYLINSPMLPHMKKDADGGLTIYIQNESPGKDKESNWLPAPKGPFATYMRLYWPAEAALDGSWTKPELIKTK